MLEFIKQYITTVLVALTIMSVAFLIFWVIFEKKLKILKKENKFVRLKKMHYYIYHIF